MKTTTKSRSRKPATKAGMLKMLLATGSVAVTLLGAEALAMNDVPPVEATAPLVIAEPVQAAPIVIKRIVTTADEQFVVVDPGRREPLAVTINNEPIPEVVVPPPPVATTKSSK